MRLWQDKLNKPRTGGKLTLFNNICLAEKTFIHKFFDFQEELKEEVAKKEKEEKRRRPKTSDL